MKTIRISNDVWEAMAEHGKFGETPDDVFRRILKIEVSIVRPGESQRKASKKDFIDALLIAKGGNRKTKSEIVELACKEFHPYNRATAKRTVDFYASTIKKRTGNDSNHLP